MKLRLRPAPGGQDVRHAWGVSAKAPAFTTIAVLSMAFGTGTVARRRE